MNIVIPMAGEGSRFSNAGYQHPKPFIPIHGRAMIEWVIENICEPMGCNHKIYLLAKLDHLPYLRDTSIMDDNNVAIVPILHKTQGALATILQANRFICDHEPLLVVNSDQYVIYKNLAWKDLCEESDGCIMTFKSTETKWSYAKVDADGVVVEVAEKKPISDNATAGIYYFHDGNEFIRASCKMMGLPETVNGEYYLAPVYNWYMKRNPNIRIFEVDAMYGMGTPEDLEKNYNLIGRYPGDRY